MSSEQLFNTSGKVIVCPIALTPIIPESIMIIQAKGWSLEEAEKMARNIFAEFEAAPGGLSIEERVRRVLTREEWERECREIRERGW